MRRLRFIRDFDFQSILSRENCVFCKVVGIRSFKASTHPILVSNDAADAAIAAGAAVEAEQADNRSQ